MQYFYDKYRNSIKKIEKARLSVISLDIQNSDEPWSLVGSPQLSFPSHQASQVPSFQFPPYFAFFLSSLLIWNEFLLTSPWLIDPHSSLEVLPNALVQEPFF